MTGYSTTINAGYGQGVYVASASSELNSNYTAWMAFDRGSSTSGSGYWVTPFTLYNSVSPWNYTGSVTTNDVSGVLYAGEWLQIYKPTSIVLSSYTITPNLAAKAPSKFWIMGSRDGTSWYLVDSRSGITSWSINIPIAFNVATSQSFNYFRIICGNLTSAPASSQYGIEIAEWVLNGTIESVNITADGRVGLGVVAPVQALEVAGSAMISGTVSSGTGLMFRNRIINGDMRIAQRGTSIVTGTGTSAAYLLDRFQTEYNIATGGLTQTQQTLITSDTPYQLGLRYSMRVTASTACSSFSYIGPRQAIEGLNISDLNWGTTFALPITMSCWIRSNAPSNSILTCALRNLAGTYTYPFNIVLIASGSWQFVNQVIPPPPSSSLWNSDNTTGIHCFLLGYDNGGTGTANSWNNNSFYRTSTTTNIWATTNNYIEYTGVQLEKGNLATPFEFRPYSIEMQLCQRYYFKIVATASNPYMRIAIATAMTTTDVFMNICIPVTLRTDGHSFEASGNIELIPGGQHAASTFFLPADGRCLNSFALAKGGVNTLTAYSTVLVRLYGSGSYIALNAEL
jgi:hypothetical protein